ncbi:prolyl oligopeptidase family serine peptidase [Rhodococcus sp. IEGM 1408]|uniref:prolyl oligopeptidase family serine peptidase n=1 Tax=Rhodococcus sp. IEGM 1408 TaxID=3082220 RepID=UPI0029555196|nr:prolyl oligopeptidase family serine peptidase [Rhodococcus sp. IEGM 1408]MDV8001592.1 prolyl oligopeptidase family serine peptidase [Rhodococcus sp. IEGM 1408]
MTAPATDPYLHLEDVDSAEALDWVRERSDRTVADLASGPHAERAHARALEILDATDRIAWPVLRGSYAYTLWRDAEHPRGLWRRVPWSVLSSGAPGVDHPAWETLVDVDALAAEEGVNWVYSGAVVRRPADDRALIRLSRGGADAVEVREYDLTARRLIPESEGGFRLREAKCSVSWVDRDTLLLSAPLDPDGADATDSGYARTARLWRRGTDPQQAPEIFAGRTEDVAVGASYDLTSGRFLASRAPDFHTSQEWFWPAGGDPVADAPHLLPVPEDCRVDSCGDWLLLRPRTDLEVAGRTHPGGSVLVLPWAAVDADPTALPDPVVLFSPTPSTTVEDVTWGRGRILLTILDDTESRLDAFAIPNHADGPWRRLTVDGLPEHVSVDVLSCDRLSGMDGTGTDGSTADGAGAGEGAAGERPHPDDAVLAVSGPIVPPSLVLLRADGTTTTLGSTPDRFDTSGIEVTRHTAVSDDGTLVPYTVMRGPGPAGPAPTILYGYGGFEISMRPSYAALRGALWLAEGGVYVVAGIRGGGEYGPAWHQAAVREKRPRAYEDFAAVARALVDTGVTTRDQLGATGGSNGGLLMGVMLTRYPELFGALAIAVPLLDMKRYHLLLAGASWMAEYGDPESADWDDFLGAYSPYQHVRPASDCRYPTVLMTTSTRDDRVHPGHARKMTAALEAAGHEVAYYENVEGGHAGAADNSQEARKAVLTYEFFRRRLPRRRPATD